MSRRPTPTEKQVAELRRLAYADIDFRQAHLLCTHIERLGPHNVTTLWVPLLAGVVVTYMKPFGRCDGLGPLPENFTHFPADSPYKQTHDDIAEGRNWTYAHRDMLKAPKLLSDTEEQEAISKVILHISKSSVTISTITPAWNPETISCIRKLCEFQISRIDAEIRRLVLILAGNKNYKVGKYVLGHDFP